MTFNKTCKDNHPLIGYCLSEDECPLCKALKEIEDLQIQREVLESTIDNLNEYM